MRIRLNYKFQFSLVMLMLLLVISSCRRDIDVKLPPYEEKLVVEASIETGQKAQVFLSYTAPYFGVFDLTQPQAFFVKNAFVTVSDGILIDTLKEALPGLGYFYIGSKIDGQVGKSYFLTVVINDKTYTAQTKILNPIALDSLFFKDDDNDSLGVIWAHLTEPAGLGNCYRFFAKRLHHDDSWAAPFNSAFEDKFVDGKPFDFSYERGTQPNSQGNAQDDEYRGFYKVGDTVAVKFCTIGTNEFLFWRSYYSNKASNGNPFAAPTNIQSSITGENAIGAFCGYSPSFDTLIIKKK